MTKLSNTEAELEKSVAYIKKRVFLSQNTGRQQGTADFLNETIIIYIDFA